MGQLRGYFWIIFSARRFEYKLFEEGFFYYCPRTIIDVDSHKVRSLFLLISLL